MTRRLTARKVECGDVRKIVARGEIEMIKKEDRPLVLTVTVSTVVRSSVRRWKTGEGEMYALWFFTIVGTFSDCQFCTEKWLGLIRLHTPLEMASLLETICHILCCFVIPFKYWQLEKKRYMNLKFRSVDKVSR